MAKKIKILCKILGHSIDEIAAEHTGEIECTRCYESTNIGAVDYTWLNQGYLKGIKNKLYAIKLWFRFKAWNLFNDGEDLPF